jgi:Uma2 family endonuclease
MSTAALVPVSEYLSTSYRPDREFVDGTILERNLGERDHSKLQTELAIFFGGLRRKAGIHVFVEQRVQVKSSRFRVPDVCVVVGPEPEEQILTKPPFLCIEILSKDDRMSEMTERLEDYLDFGVPFIWLFDPRLKRAWSYTREGLHESADGLLRTANPEIVLAVAEVLS